MMKIFNTSLPEVKIIKLKKFTDSRGSFTELISKQHKFHKFFINSKYQDNLSISKKNVIRGLHFQTRNPQSKLVSVLKGKVLDVIVDIRKNSKNFGKNTSHILSDKNNLQIFIPEGFAHGFSVLSDEAIFYYKCSSNYDPKNEKGIIYNDPFLKINWKVKKPILSSKDKNNKSIFDFTSYELPKI